MLPDRERDFSPRPGSMDAFYVPPDTHLGGPIESPQSVWVEGTVQGHLRADGELTVTEDGAVHGSVEAQSADIGGLVDGDITVRGKLVLETSARVRGTVTASQIVVEKGARFTGDCQIKTSSQPAETSASTTHEDQPALTRIAG